MPHQKLSSTCILLSSSVTPTAQYKCGMRLHGFVVRKFSAFFLLMCVVQSGCGADSFRGRRDTLVSRERRAGSNSPAAEYFSAVYGYQLVLGRVDSRRADKMASLAQIVGLLPNADRTEIGTAIRQRLDEEHLTRIQVRFGPPSDVDSRVEAWFASVVAPPSDDTERTSVQGRYNDLVGAVDVTYAPAVTAPGLAVLMQEISGMLRDAEATRRCMAQLSGDLPSVLSRGAELRAQSPASLGPEFADAERFVMSIHARATLHTQESARIERWLIDVLVPETEGNAGENSSTTEP
jgi:hypothetical protein